MHPVQFEPVEIFHERDHRFVKRKQGRGCEECGKGRHDMAHVGAPQSLNVLGSGANHFTYQAMKKAWQQHLRVLLLEAGLPRELGRVLVEGEVCFPDRQKRDQGNYRYIIEKALGDALQEGWLADDSWEFYEFGQLAYRYEKGRSWTRLMIFPMRLERERLARAVCL